MSFSYFKEALDVFESLKLSQKKELEQIAKEITRIQSDIFSEASDKIFFVNAEIAMVIVV